MRNGSVQMVHALLVAVEPHEKANLRHQALGSGIVSCDFGRARYIARPERVEMLEKALWVCG